MKKICFLFFFIITCSSFAQVRKKADSLLQQIPFTKDSALVRLYCNTASQFARINPDTCRLFATRALQLATQLNYPYGKSSAYNALGIAHHMYGNFDSAIYYYEKSLAIRRLLHNKKDEAQVVNNIALSCFIGGKFPMAIRHYTSLVSLCRSMKDTLGAADALNSTASVFIEQADYEKALSCYLSAEKLFTLKKDLHGMAQVQNNIGIIYGYMGNDSLAAIRYQRSIDLSVKAGREQEASYSYSNLGTIYQKRGELNKAMTYYQKALEFNKASLDESGMSVSYINIGALYMEKNELQKAEQQFMNALAIQQRLNDSRGVADAHLNLGRLYLRKKEFARALDFLNKAMATSREAGLMEYITEIYAEYSALYKAKGDFRRSYEYLDRYTELKDSLLNEEKSRNLAAMQQRFESEKREAEIAALKKDQELHNLRAAEQQHKGRKQWLIIFIALGAVLIVLVLVFFLLKGYFDTKKASDQLSIKNSSLIEQKQVLEEKNMVVTDSIEYARSIQETILPTAAQLKPLLPEHFILYKPKDIVAGDFYWLQQNAGALYFAACDCTGHGVPGAFMSMHAYYLLERIMKEKAASNPAAVLDELNQQMSATLHQTSQQVSAKYGIDMALIKIKDGVVEYSGARNPLLIAGNNIEEIKADRIYIGGAREKFTNHVVQPPKGSMLYLFTDGYADQKGGPEGKKFFATAFRDLLLSVSGLPVQQQKEKLETVFEQWKGDREQMDDVLVAGIRIS